MGGLLTKMDKLMTHKDSFADLMEDFLKETKFKKETKEEYKFDESLFDFIKSKKP